MANKRTVALTREQYVQLITAIRSGYSSHRPNRCVAEALMLEANLGLRISDIVRLHLKDIVRDGDRYRLNIREKKTGKARVFTVPMAIYEHMRLYCLDGGIPEGSLMFPVTEREVQAILCYAADWFGYKNIGTHSFRKFFATQIYNDNDCNIVLVQQLLQHCSPAVTQKYIGVSTKDIEDALNKHIDLI